MLKCLLLAAGKGNRLRPLTVGRAKPALPVVGRPLLLSTLDRLAEAGVTEVLVNLHHRPDTIRDLVEQNLPETMSVTFSEEPEILGTGGGLKEVEGLLRDEDLFLIVNGDCYYGFSFVPIIQAHRSYEGMATMALRPMPPHGGFGKVELDAAGCIQRIAGMPRGAARPIASERMFVGVHVIGPGIWKHMARGGHYDINADVYPAAITAGAVLRGFDVGGTWHDIGTPRRYLTANLDLLHASFGSEATPAWPGVDAEPPVHAGPGVTIGGSCTLQGGVVIGAGVTIEHSVQVVRSVILDGCRIGARSTIHDSIIADGAEVPPDTDLIECVVFPTAGHEQELRKREIQGSNVIARFDTYERR